MDIKRNGPMNGPLHGLSKQTNVRYPGNIILMGSGGGQVLSLLLRRSEFELPRSLQFLKMAIPCIFLSSFSSFRTAIYGHYNFFADNWIRTADLWYQKQPR